MLRVLARMTWMLLTMHLAAWQATTVGPRAGVQVEHAMRFVEVPSRRYHLRVIEPDPDVAFAVRQLAAAR